MIFFNKAILTVMVLSLGACSTDWGYKGSKGPAHWGKIKEKYKFCSVGFNQSPIDIDFTSINGRYEIKDHGLTYAYKGSAMTKEKLANNLHLAFERGDYFSFYKKKYYLQWIEFHHPSEHLINGQQEVLEMQMMHKSDSEQRAVLAFFVTVGKENLEMKPVIDLLENDAKNAWQDVDLGKVINKRRNAFFYDGSLTSPPCTEGVKWYVMKRKIEMSKEQINKIIALALDGKANARDVQEFNPALY